jgi:hypothetical protein
MTARPSSIKVPAQLMDIPQLACARSLATAYRLLEDFGNLRPGDCIIQVRGPPRGAAKLLSSPPRAPTQPSAHREALPPRSPRDRLS